MSKKLSIKYYANYIFKGGFIVSLGEIIVKAMGIALLPVFTVYLSPTDFGTIAMVTSIVSFLSLFYNPGVISASQRMYYDTDSDTERKEIIGSSFLFFLVFPLFFSLLVAFVGPYLTSKLFTDFNFYPYGYIAILLAFFNQPKRMWILLLSIKHRIQETSIYVVCGAIFSTALSLFLVVKLNYGPLGKVLALIPSAMFIFFIANLAVYRFTNLRWSWQKLKEILKFGFPLVLAIWSYEILFIADRFILEGMIGSEQLGIYSLGYQVAQIPIFIAIGIRKIWNPIFYENMKNKSYDTVQKLVKIYLLFVTVMHVSIIFFAKELMLLLVDSRFYGAIPIIGIITAGVFFSSLLTISNSFLGYEKKFKTTSKIASFAAVLNIVLNVVMIPFLGIIGAALATLISYMVYFGIGIYVVRDFDKILKIKKVLVICLLFLLISVSYVFVFRGEEFYLSEILIKLLMLAVFIGIIIKLKIINISKLVKFVKK
ncbi:MAG: O-antigen/teichoic acid export membrane protein [bacterium]